MPRGLHQSAHHRQHVAAPNLRRHQGVTSFSTSSSPTLRVGRGRGKALKGSRVRGPLLPEPVGHGGAPYGKFRPRATKEPRRRAPEPQRVGRPLAGGASSAAVFPGAGSVSLALRASDAVGQSAFCRRYGSHPTGPPRGPARARGARAPLLPPARSARPPGPAPPVVAAGLSVSRFAPPSASPDRGRPPALTRATVATPAHQAPRPQAPADHPHHDTQPHHRRPAPEPTRRRGDEGEVEKGECGKRVGRNR